MKKRVEKRKIVFLELILVLLPLLFCFCSEHVAYDYTNEDLVASQMGEGLETEELSFGPGVYRVSLTYMTDDPECSIFLETEGKVLADWITLRNLEYRKTFHFWVLEEVEDLRLILSRSQGETNLTVDRLRIVRSDQIYFLISFGIGLFCILAHFMAWFVRRYQQYGKKGIIVPGILLGIVILNTLISWGGDQVQGGIDLNFHLYRIEGIAAALSQGQFPVRMQPLWMNNYGYATSLFYGELFLYLPAVLRLIGLPGEWSFHFFVMVFHAITVCCAYFSFKWMTGKREIGIVGAILISFCQYRMVDLSYRAAIGEWQAFAFAPLVVCGVYRLLTEDPVEERYKQNTLIAILGFSGLIQTHLLSCLMMGMFTILTCLIYLKEVLVRERFMELCKVVVCTTIVNLWFILPMLDFMRDKFFVNDGSRDYSTIQETGVKPGSLFSFLVGGNGELNPSALGWGMGLMGIGIILWILLHWHDNEQGRRKKLLWGSGLTLLALFLSTNLFPYDFLKRVGLLNKLIVTIQFPWRFLMVAAVFLTATVCMILAEAKQKLKDGQYRTTLLVISLLAVVTGLQYDLTGERKFFSEEAYYDAAGLDSFSQNAGEYIPSGTDPAYLTNTYVYNLDGKVYVSDYQIDKGIIEVECENTGNEEGVITVPLLYYRGYEAKDLETGRRFSLLKDDNNSLQVAIPADYAGRLRIQYEGFWYWRVAEIISLAFLGVSVVKLGKDRRRKV